MFLWHQRNPNLEDIRRTAWLEGMVIVVTTDASGDIGWGVCAQDHWAQGTWTAEEEVHSINWKELKAYHYALCHLREVLF